jgi:hypothetical protein
MFIRSIVLSVALSGPASLSPAWLAESAPSALPAPGTSVAFGPSLFVFKTTIPDDGTGQAGGWQETGPRLTFVDGRHLVPHVWTCHVMIGLPLRTGGVTISAAKAAEMSADVATDASIKVMHKQPNWLPVLYCFALEAEMQALFKTRYGTLGQRIKVK